MDSMFILYQLGFYPHNFNKSRVRMISQQNRRFGTSQYPWKSIPKTLDIQNTHDSIQKPKDPYLFALLPLLPLFLFLFSSPSRRSSSPKCPKYERPIWSPLFILNFHLFEIKSSSFFLFANQVMLYSIMAYSLLLL